MVVPANVLGREQGEKGRTVTPAEHFTFRAGGKWSNGHGLVSCTAAGHPDKHPSMTVFDGRDGKLLLKCQSRGCAFEDQIAGARALGLLDTGNYRPIRSRRLARQPAPKKSSTLKYAKEIWPEGNPLIDTEGLDYFERERTLDIRDLDLHHCLRWHAEKRIVMALMTDPKTDEFIGVQQTIMNDFGIKPERKTLGSNAVIKLTPHKDVTHGLAIAEGCECGLRVLLLPFAPVWACVNVAVMEAFPVLPGVECLTIFPDTGEAGETAAKECAHRWSTAGREVKIIPPESMLK